LTDHHATNLLTLSVLLSVKEIVTAEHTRIRVHPVAQGGTDAKMGAKNTATMKQTPVTIAVKPVLPPSAIPAPLSMKAVTGELPNKAPTEMKAASVQ